MAKFGQANTWIQDSDKFELYSDGSGKVLLRPASGEFVEPGAPKNVGGAGIAAVPTNTSDTRLVSPTEQAVHRVDADADGDASG